jgi:hypothetical protein
VCPASHVTLCYHSSSAAELTASAGPPRCDRLSSFGVADMGCVEANCDDRSHQFLSVFQTTEARGATCCCVANVSMCNTIHLGYAVYQQVHGIINCGKLAATGGLYGMNPVKSQFTFGSLHLGRKLNRTPARWSSTPPWHCALLSYFLHRFWPIHHLLPSLSTVAASAHMCRERCVVLCCYHTPPLPAACQLTARRHTAQTAKFGKYCLQRAMGASSCGRTVIYSYRRSLHLRGDLRLGMLTTANTRNGQEPEMERIHGP